MNDTGRAYLDRCQELLEQFDEVETAVKVEHGRPRGRIRITASTAFGERYLCPLLAEFLKTYPDIQVEIYLTNRKVALVEEGYDLALRIGSLTDLSMIAHNLAPMRIVVCASQEYLNNHSIPQFPSELTQHTCIIDTSFQNEQQWVFKIAGQLERVTVDGPFQANSPEAARQMIIGGVGIGICPMYIVNSDIVAGRIQVLFEQFEAYGFGVYAIYPHRRHLSNRVRTQVEHLAANFRKL